MNGVCGASRLLGVYHLWPQIIPIPSTESVDLRTEDEYVVIATDSLWKHINYDQITYEVKSVSDPIQAAKRLCDLAVAYGCSTDVSVLVVKLNIDRDPSVISSTNLQRQAILSAAAAPLEAAEEDDPVVTNIDDPISEEEEEMEGDTESHPLPALPTAPNQDNMDRLVLDAIIGSPLTGQAQDQPTMQSTNFDDLPLTDESPSEPFTPMGGTESTLPRQVARDQRPPYPIQQVQQMQQLQQQMEMDYEAQTMPKRAQAARKNSGLTHLETSFEQTQVC